MLSTAEFAAAIGVSESSVRRMADAGELNIHRTRGGHRRIPASEAVRYVREHKVSILRPDLLGLVGKDNSSTGGDFADQLLSAFTSGHAKSVIGLMQTMYMQGMSIASMCDGPIHAALQAIGDRWPRDKKAIFIEHRATLLCVRALCQIRMSMLEPDEGAPTAMGAAPADDPYLLPSLMVSLVLHDCGFDETNLGPNTPLDVLCDSVEDEQPSLVWVAVTNPIRSRNYHRELENLAAAVKAYGGLLLIGGRSAETYEGSDAVLCSSMTELQQRAQELVKLSSKKRADTSANQ
jgi:excisionase family DNA binding protein